MTARACPPLRAVCRHDMVTHMKTTIDIADSVLEAAKEAAAREGTTLRALVEQGLRAVLGQRRRRSPRFQLRDASFKGSGLQPGVDLSRWEDVAGDSYRGRGT